MNWDYVEFIRNDKGILIEVTNYHPLWFWEILLNATTP